MCRISEKSSQTNEIIHTHQLPQNFSSTLCTKVNSTAVTKMKEEIFIDVMI